MSRSCDAVIRIDYARSSEHDTGWSAVAYLDADAWSANESTRDDDGLPGLVADLARLAGEHAQRLADERRAALERERART